MNKNGDDTLLGIRERHDMILMLLQQNGSISVTALAEQFKVSKVTI